MKLRSGEVHPGVFIASELGVAPSEATLTVTSSNWLEGESVWEAGCQEKDKYVYSNIQRQSSNTISGRICDADIREGVLSYAWHDSDEAQYLGEVINQHISALYQYKLLDTEGYYDADDIKQNIDDANIAFSRIMGFSKRLNPGDDRQQLKDDLIEIAKRLSARLEVLRRFRILRVGQYICKSPNIWVSDDQYSRERGSLTIARLAGVAVSSIKPQHQVKLPKSPEDESEGILWEKDRDSFTAVIEGADGGMYLMPRIRSHYEFYTYHPPEAEKYHYANQYSEDIRDLRCHDPYEYRRLLRRSERDRRARIRDQSPIRILP